MNRRTSEGVQGQAPNLEDATQATNGKEIGDETKY